MRSNLQLSTVGYDDLLGSFSRLVAIRFDFSDNIHALDNSAKDNMTVVQPGGLHGGDEELGTVCVGSSVGHGHNAGSSVLKDEVLIFELVSVDGLSSSSVMVLEIATLAHEVRNDTVESGSLVTEALLSGAESAEVFTCFWSYICA